MDRFRGEDGWKLVWLLFGIAIAAVATSALYTYLGTFLFALFLYYATRPLYRRLEEHFDHPDLTVTVTLLAVVLPMSLVVGYGVYVAFQELGRLLATHSLQGYSSYFQPYLSLVREGHIQQLWDALVTNPGEPLSPAVRRVIQQALGRVVTVAGFAFAVLSRLFLMSVFLFYLLRDDHKLRDWFYDSIDHRDRAVSFASAVDDDLETVYFSNLAIIAFTGTLATIVYYALNFLAGSGPVVATPLLLGLLTGIATLVPVVGMKLVYVPYALFLAGLAAAGQRPLWYPVAFLLVALVVVDTIPDFFVRSWLSARSSVPMGLIFLSYVLGVMVFGWMGLFLGPLVAVLLVHFGRSVFPWLASERSST